MSRAKRREMLTGNLDQILTSYRATEAANRFAWSFAVDVIVELHVLGLASDPRVGTLLELTLDRLAPERWADKREFTARLRGFAEPDDLYSLARSWESLALARWIATSKPQTELFVEAAALQRAYFEQVFGKSKTWHNIDLARRIIFSCAAHDLADVIALFARPPMEKYRDLTLSKINNAIRLGHALAQHVVNGMFSSDEIAYAGERTLTRQVRLTLGDGHHESAALLAYFVTTVIGATNDAPGVLANLSTYAQRGSTSER